MRLLRLPRQDVIVAMTTPPFVVLAAVLHQLLHRRTRIVLWSMDCYPDAAERFGELRPGGVASRTLRALNRWLFRRIELVVGLDGAMVELLESQYAASPSQPHFAVVPNWERLRSSRPRTSRSGRATTPSTWVIAPSCSTSATRASAIASTPCWPRLNGWRTTPSSCSSAVVRGGTELEATAAARGLTNVVFQTYVPKDDTPAVMAGADVALITLDERSLGVMSPSKLHANLAAGLPVLYVGPVGSNVDEAIARHGAGRSLREGDVDGVVAAVQELRGDAEVRARARRAFEDAYSDEAALPDFDRLLEG